MTTPRLCVLLCGRDTAVAGYIYGACNECVKRLILQRLRDQKSYERLAKPQAGGKA